MSYFNLKYFCSGGVLYENVKMMNSETQETLDQLDAHNKARSHVITCGLAGGNHESEGISNSSG